MFAKTIKLLQVPCGTSVDEISVALTENLIRGGLNFQFFW